MSVLDNYNIQKEILFKMECLMKKKKMNKIKNKKIKNNKIKNYKTKTFVPVLHI